MNFFPVVATAARQGAVEDVRQHLTQLNDDLQRGVAACAVVAGVTGEERPRSALRSYLVAQALAARPEWPIRDNESETESDREAR